MSALPVSRPNSFFGYASFNELPIVNTLQSIFDRYAISDICCGIAKSRILKAVVLTGLTFKGLFLLVPNPAQWLVASCILTALFISLYSPYVGFRYIEFELLAPYRLLRTQNYAEIRWYNQTSYEGKIILGAIPNRLRSHAEHLINDRQLQAVLSVNEPWEREIQFLSIPYSAQDWQQLGVSYQEINVIDHAPLNNDELHRAADFIQECVSVGKTTYVHCRAGKGRSAMGVAAYLIKHQDKTATEAVAIIKRCRPCSTVNWKISYLEAFEASIRGNASET